MSQFKKQQGVALLTILIMVVLATILAMSILKAQQQTLDETKLLMRQDQAFLYVQSAEYFFSELLDQDVENNDIDHLGETWAQPFPLFPVEDGYISGQMYDEHNKFNLNTLLKADGTVNEVAVEFFKQLLQRLELNPELVETFIDWQDADEDTVGAMGAENSYYRGVKAGYLAPNQMFTSIQQVQWLRGVDRDMYQRLKPYITALPSRDTKMNLNTVDALLLACLNEQLDVVSIQNLLAQKKQNLEYLTQFDELVTQAPFDRIDPQQLKRYGSLFGGASQYFRAEIIVNLSERRRVMTSQLHRDNGQVQAYQRRWLLQSEQP